MTGTPSTPFSLPLRVYYEDTDAGGVVYYANYLRFMERARMEWMSAGGVDLPSLASDGNAEFVVTRVEAEYKRPAKLGDYLAVTAEPLCFTAATIELRQRVLRGETLLVTAKITLAMLNARTHRPMRLTEEVKSRLSSPGADEN